MSQTTDEDITKGFALLNSMSGLDAAQIALVLFAAEEIRVEFKGTRYPLSTRIRGLLSAALAKAIRDQRGFAAAMDEAALRVSLESMTEAAGPPPDDDGGEPVYVAPEPDSEPAPAARTGGVVVDMEEFRRKWAS
jgi:hypothetical protein